MSIPPFLDLPNGVAAGTIHTRRGDFACLDNRSGMEPRPPVDDRAIVCIPGFTGSKEDFIAILGPLADTGRRAVAVDLRGQFESAGPAEKDAYSLAGFGADILAISAELGSPVHLVGHSLGGLVARESVVADASAVASLVLMGSGPAAIPLAQQPHMQLFAQVLATQGLANAWAAKQAFDRAQGLALPLDLDIEAFLTRRFLANAIGSLLAMIDILCLEADRTGELAQVEIPKLVCFGEHDDAWPPDVQRAMSRALGAPFTELPGVGHSPAVQDPDLTIAALTEFWNEIASATDSY